MLRIRTKPHPTRPGVFVASFEGKTLCISRTPLADAARALLKMGFPPATLVTMRHEGSAHDSFVPETLANWSARAYEETAHGPRLTEWKPFSGIPKDGDAAVPSGRTDDSGENPNQEGFPKSGSVTRGDNE